MTARDIMTTDVQVVRDTQTVIEAAQLFRDGHFGGAPVVTEKGKLVGIVTNTDISGVLLERQLYDLLAADVTHELVEPSVKDAFVDDMAGDLIGHVMTPSPISASPDTPVAELAAMMLEHQIHRLIIVEGKNVAGMVSSMDVLKYFVHQS
jgi:CBS domain-containing protein